MVLSIIGLVLIAVCAIVILFNSSSSGVPANTKEPMREHDKVAT